MAKIVEVWRLEHVSCSRKHFNQLPKVKHGPWSASICNGSARPPFGHCGTEPVRIEPYAVCGVTRRQYNDWWSVTLAEFNKKKPLWRDAGWAFVVYKVPKTRLRWDNNQVIFNPLNIQSRRVMMWDEVPMPVR